MNLLLCGLPTLLSGLIGIGLLILGIKSAGKLKSKFQQAWQEVDHENKTVLKNWQEANDRLMKTWKNAMDRWEHLYYCHRDDCVFIPEEGTSAPLGKLKEYLETVKPIQET